MSADFSEQDVDTITRLILSYIPKSFESMSNPPGGDWSGLSLINDEEGILYKWISLEREREDHMKMPDHVFQILNEENLTTLLIESKDLLSKIEPNVGDDMKKFIFKLLSKPPTVFIDYPVAFHERFIPNKEIKYFIKGQPKCYSGIACLNGKQESIHKVLVEAKADFAISLYLNRNEKKCLSKLYLFETDEKLKKYFEKMTKAVPEEYGISFEFILLTRVPT